LDVKTRFIEEQIIGFMREAEAGVPVKDLCWRHGLSEASYYLWRSKFGDMSVPDAKRLEELEAENTRLKNPLAEQVLENDVIKDVLRKTGERTGPAGTGARQGRQRAERTPGAGGRTRRAPAHSAPPHGPTATLICASASWRWRCAIVSIASG
jgi:putative transposase